MGVRARRDEGRGRHLIYAWSARDQAVAALGPGSLLGWPAEPSVSTDDGPPPLPPRAPRRRRRRGERGPSAVVGWSAWTSPLRIPPTSSPGSAPAGWSASHRPGHLSAVHSRQPLRPRSPRHGSADAYAGSAWWADGPPATPRSPTPECGRPGPNPHCDRVRPGPPAPPVAPSHVPTRHDLRPGRRRRGPSRSHPSPRAPRRRARPGCAGCAGGDR